MIEVTREQIIQWNATREVRSMRTRNIRKVNKPYACREVVFTCSNGWTIERLVPEDYPIEGFFMGHCLAVPRFARSYHSQKFYSLREPDGTPHVTISLYWSCTGRADARPKPEYMALVREWQPTAGAAGAHPDEDTAYHDDGRLDDRDYRDVIPYWRDNAWKNKRKEAVNAR